MNYGVRNRAAYEAVVHNGATKRRARRDEQNNNCTRIVILQWNASFQ